MVEVSIIIPTLNEERYIASCLDSVVDSDLKMGSYEVLVIDGLSSDNTVNIVKEYMQKYDFIKLYTNEKRIIPAAMNIGIKNAQGEYIIRIDAHSLYPKEYFSKLFYWAKKLDADNVGGVCVTDVLSKTPKTNSIKAVMSHKFGVGGGDYRGKIDKPKRSNTVPFGCFKREALLKYGGFDERLERTEDLEINKRFIDRGGKVYIVPDLSFTYYAKERLGDLAKKSFNTGKWVVLNPYITKSFSSLHLHHIIPLIFILSLLLPSLLAFVNKNFLIISIASFLLYFTAIIYFSIKLKQKNNSFFYLLTTFITLHISYGLGSLVGIGTIISNYLKKSLLN